MDAAQAVRLLFDFFDLVRLKQEEEGQTQTLAIDTSGVGLRNSRLTWLGGREKRTRTFEYFGAPLLLVVP